MRRGSGFSPTPIIVGLVFMMMAGMAVLNQAQMVSTMTTLSILAPLILIAGGLIGLLPRRKRNRQR
ncbi:hypothetical protein [Propionimicrobium sp. PCR01-08-3]|uniref:hypothetical protein n=1 Tax=Propionimicrobium sp. PCR01-08-3 TaxID=3052086 RepID=UPI00255CFF60|nr:hypothetical protein [Propionimicrobium sp. PCR01-08-3]WIY83264.1 hypothetical protein QQ658_02575 [Propionimicrobium sp. PCR01-08-3]